MSLLGGLSGPTQEENGQDDEDIPLLPLGSAQVETGQESERNMVMVYDGEPDEKPFNDEEALRKYLRRYPENDNDTATRLFRYTQDCSTNLKLALFEKFPFLQFSMTPTGLAGAYGNPGLNTGTCRCDRCKSGIRCMNRALEFTFPFWTYMGTIPDEENRLEVTGNDQSFIIYAGGQ